MKINLDNVKFDVFNSLKQLSSDQITRYIELRNELELSDVELHKSLGLNKQLYEITMEDLKDELNPDIVTIYPSKRIFLAEHNSKIIAFAEVVENSMEVESQYSIRGFFVDKDYRNQGVGTKLMNKVIDYMNTHMKGSVLQLACLVNNEYAMKLYSNLGFIPRYYGMTKV